MRKAGIIPELPKQEVEEYHEPEPKPIVFTNQDDEDAWMDENGDDEDFIRSYRQKRLDEIQIAALKPRFGEVREITGQDYVQEVNKAGDGIWVVLLLYRQG